MFAFFYDNCISNAYDKHLCPHILFHKIRHTYNFERLDPILKREYDVLFDAILHVNPNFCLPGAAYARMYAAQIKRMGGRYEFDPLAGDIIESTGEDFIMHVESACRASNVRAFIFDWDRTLQKTELMLAHLSIDDLMRMLHIPPESKSLFIQGVAIYHAGGANRYIRLVNMFRQLAQHRVYIYTANPAVRTASIDIYQSVLQDWGCPQAFIQYSEHKYRDMSQDAFLSSL